MKKWSNLHCSVFLFEFCWKWEGNWKKPDKNPEELSQKEQRGQCYFRVQVMWDNPNRFLSKLNGSELPDSALYSNIITLLMWYFSVYSSYCYFQTQCTFIKHNRLFKEIIGQFCCEWHLISELLWDSLDVLYPHFSKWSCTLETANDTKTCKDQSKCVRL